MRFKSLSVRQAPPVHFFAIDELADVVVIAGPNGVGKTRLLNRITNHLRAGGPDPLVVGVVAATSQDEVSAWGKHELDLANGDDLNLLRTMFQASRRRKNWSSSLINFESDRTIQNLQPLAFSWDMPDPDEEAVSWDLTFGLMRDRFQDTVHAMFRMIEAQKQSIATRAVQLRREGRDEMRLTFSDPMEPFKRIFSMLLAPKELVDPSARNQRLQYSLAGQVHDFTSLSSGEREVVNIAFDFQLRRPYDCIVFFDEPELHLHPELSYKLIQTLQQIGGRNQFFFSTHSPDVITASLDQSVIFLSPATGASEDGDDNQAIAVSESDETHRALRLLGQSIGVVALGRKIVLIEGEQSSLDKQTYGSILAGEFPDLVLVPSGGKHVIESFDAVYEAVLNRTIWGVDFYMLCDRDSRPPDSSEQSAALETGRLRVLPRYHLESFFLDETVWATALAPMEASDSWLVDPAQIRDALRGLARGFISYAAALAVSHDLRQRVGNVDLMAKESHGKTVGEIQDLIAARAGDEIRRLGDELDADAVRESVRRHFEAIEQAVEDDDETWKALVPGKPLLNTFASKMRLHPARAKALYLQTAATSSVDPFLEITEIFRGFARGQH